MELMIDILHNTFNVPNSWNLIKIKNLLSSKVTDGPHETPEFIDEGIPFLSVDSIVDGRLVFDGSRYISVEDYNKFKLKCDPQRDDVFMGKAASIGKIAIVDVDFNFSIWSPLALLRPNKNMILPKFLEYSLKSDYAQDQIDLYATSNTQKNISMGDIPRINLLIPSLDEQDFIVNFLNKKTSEIEKNITKNKELINLLEEKKAALINQVVTKGLNPNVPMKDSGIEWFDEIPNHWVTVKAKRFTKIETGGTPKRENLSYWENGTINWITSGEVNQEVINDSINKISIDGLKNSNAHLLPINSVVMALSGQGQTKGRVAVLNISTCCSQSVGAFICDNKNIFYKFLFYYLKSRYSDIRGLVGDNLRDGLSLSIIGNIPILLPPYEEQENISKFLDREIPRIEDSIKKIQENINLLEEYKSSLIHHVVTGKIDVREEEI